MPTPAKPVDASTLVPEPSPADWAAPNSLAAVLTARAAFAVLPVVKSLESMLIGIVAIRNGVLRVFSMDSDDVEESMTTTTTSRSRTMRGFPSPGATQGSAGFGAFRKSAADPTT